MTNSFRSTCRLIRSSAGGSPRVYVLVTYQARSCSDNSIVKMALMLGLFLAERVFGVGCQEGIEIAAQDFVWVTRFMPRAKVFDLFVWMEHVA